jgi:putative membrane protein
MYPDRMRLVADIAVLVVALLHIGFLVLEMFLWTKPFGRKTFGLSRELAEASKSLAANQGLYNGFLAAGLIWGVIEGDRAFAIKVFFLGCVIVAGIFGAITAKRSILFVQAIPGLIALILVWLTFRGIR